MTFESDWRKAKRILDEAGAEFTVDITREATEPRRGDERFLIHYRKLTPVVYTSVADHGVLLTLRYLCEPRQRRGSAGDLWERVLDAFAAEPDVVLAYPTQRVNLDREIRAQGGAAPEGATRDLHIRELTLSLRHLRPRSVIEYSQHLGSPYELES